MKIFIDIDGVLWNTEKAIVELYNKKYGYNADWRDVKDWNFSPAIPAGTPDNVINDLFESDEVYSGNNTYEGAVEYIKKLNEEFEEVYFCTVGKNINNSKKLEMLKRLIPEVKVITISFPYKVLSDKSMINMQGAIFIDDHSSNLNSSNAKYKILFEPNDIKNWNKKWEGIRLKTWKDVYNFIKTVKSIEYIINEKFIKLLSLKEKKCEIDLISEEIKKDIVKYIKSSINCK
ncbi:5' nucleotidase, NT5C type [Hypnocyclicus thermotrophus]|nr:hypothetical protein [Hypnocyclicus thermotrophus]